MRRRLSRRYHSGQPEMESDDARARLEEVVRAYSRFIHRLVRKLAGQRAAHMAQDVEQAVYLGIWRQLEQGREIHYPLSYVYKAAVRETLRLLREPRWESLDGPLAGGAEPASRDAPSRSYERIRQVEALDACLQLLSVDRRAAVKAHLAGFSVDEIMRMYGWPYQKARNLIARGISDLRLGLRKRGIDD
jgi:RNA polymerase sigma factor (sigma-70 family)